MAGRPFSTMNDLGAPSTKGLRLDLTTSAACIEIGDFYRYFKSDTEFVLVATLRDAPATTLPIPVMKGMNNEALHTIVMSSVVSTTVLTLFR